MPKVSLKPKTYKPIIVDNGNNLGKRCCEIAAQAKLDDIAAAKRLCKREQNAVLKQLLPSFVSASKEGQVTAYMSRASLVWFLRFPDPTEEEVFVHENFKDDPAYEEYIQDTRRKWMRKKLSWMCGSFATTKDGPKPEKPIWVLELNSAAQEILSKLEMPWKWDPEALAALEAIEKCLAPCEG